MYDDDDDLHRRELRYENLMSMFFCSMLKGAFIEIFIHSNVYIDVDQKLIFELTENAFGIYHTHHRCLPPFLCKFSNLFVNILLKRTKMMRK